jgi:hypothetical protein
MVTSCVKPSYRSCQYVYIHEFGDVGSYLKSAKLETALEETFLLTQLVAVNHQLDQGADKLDFDGALRVVAYNDGLGT